MSQYDAVVIFHLPQDLKTKVETQARDEGLSMSAHIRRILTIWHDPDRVTLERCGVLVDPGVEYEVE